jgi:DNA-binding SARP family transcriptional activator
MAGVLSVPSGEPGPPVLRLELLGRIRATVDGREVELPPAAAAVLAYLALADGEPVPVDELHRAVWPEDRPGRTPGEWRPDRTKVHKRISQLRVLLDPDHQGEASRLVVTERAAVSSYRLAVRRADVDCARFEDLVDRARDSAAANAVVLLTEALALWRGRPLADVADRGFAARLATRISALRDEARRELFAAHRTLNQYPQALAVGRELLAESPDDAALIAAVAEVRDKARARDAALLRQDFPSFAGAVRLVEGDLFDQDDAHLIVGFTDTFDTIDDPDRRLVSPDTVQSQLLRRLYGGDRARLERDLRVALRDAPRVGRIDRSDKPLGKLTRYPVGTVAVLRLGGRRVFAVAYSRWDDSGRVVGSSAGLLAESLDRVWSAAHHHGQRGPVAVGLLGRGLSRVSDAGPQELLRLIAERYVAASRTRQVADELRIVVRPGVAGGLDLPGFAGYLHTL